MAILFRSLADAKQAIVLAFPGLAAAKWRITSPYDDSYQCIAWAACRTDSAWWPWDHPRYYWPPGFQKFPPLSPVPVQSFVEVFEKKFGYRKCSSPAFEFGYQKVAIYANSLGVTHMARQHFLGRGWLSKLGDLEDIVHSSPLDLTNDIVPTGYGSVAQVMKRGWWVSIASSSIFRSSWASLRFWLYRKMIPWHRM
jgi:hypothetical protein